MDKSYYVNKPKRTITQIIPADAHTRPNAEHATMIIIISCCVG